MGASKKGRRSIVYQSQTFIWWVGEDEESCGEVWLNIVSDDKSIVLSYRVGEGDFYIISKGRMFQRQKTSGCWEWYVYPMESPPLVITPKFVFGLVAWAVDGNGAVRYDTKGDGGAGKK